MYMELEVQCTCMYDPNKCWFYVSKTYCFCFLLTFNCEKTAACNVLELISVYDLSNTILCPICSALTKHPVASQIWTHNSKRLAYTLTT